MSADAPGQWTIRDGNGNPFQAETTVNPTSGAITPQFALRSNGAPIELGNPLPTQQIGLGIGAMTSVPAGSADGTPLGVMPSGATGVRFYLPPNATVTFTIAPSQPGSAPSATFTTPVSTAAASWDEALSGQMIYVTATSGSPLFRWR